MRTIIALLNVCFHIGTVLSRYWVSISSTPLPPPTQSLEGKDQSFTSCNNGELKLWCLTQLSTIFQLCGQQSVLLVEETWVSGENHRPVASR